MNFGVSMNIIEETGISISLCDFGGLASFQTSKTGPVQNDMTQIIQLLNKNVPYIIISLVLRKYKIFDFFLQVCHTFLPKLASFNIH